MIHFQTVTPKPEKSIAQLFSMRILLMSRRDKELTFTLIVGKSGEISLRGSIRPEDLKHSKVKTGGYINNALGVNDLTEVANIACRTNGRRKTGQFGGVD